MLGYGIQRSLVENGDTLIFHVDAVRMSAAVRKELRALLSRMQGAATMMSCDMVDVKESRTGFQISVKLDQTADTPFTLGDVKKKLEGYVVETAGWI